MTSFPCHTWLALLLLCATLSLPTRAAFVNFQNCLDQSIQDIQPLELQWVPYFVDATFDTSYPNQLQVTLYGNVTGQQVQGNYPPPSSPTWANDNDTFGKIANIGSGNKFATLFSKFDDLSYSAWDAPAAKFCEHVTQGHCPLGPRFYANPENPSDLAAFQITHNFGSPYQFSTLAATVTVISGDTSAQTLACVTANITPAFGSAINNLLTWLPAAILIFKGLATLFAAIWSPWGSSDIFRWSSNYGRDEDLLRLVTPGFGDCLQYIQFVVLMGSLTLNYPGFFQPAVSHAAWSLLLFNTSYVTGGPGHQSVVDGVYSLTGTYGISQIRQLIGMTAPDDVWACMAIWLAVIAGIILVLCQIGFFARWVHLKLTKSSEQDLLPKNIPFTLGNMIRLAFNFFILPIIALSLFQLVIAPVSPTSVIAVAAVLLAVWIVSAIWILRVIFITKPRTLLFDMPALLLYGPLYNTYTDTAAPFAFVPILITFMRGVSFGAVQPSGIAQLVILAVCEVCLLIALNGFLPFANYTSNNAYHTTFAVVRLVTIFLSITFIPSLAVSESAKGWIGYTILLLHGCVLVFGFFLNSAMTVVEVAARSFGLAGRDAQTGQARGSILHWRMLKKRQDRPVDPVVRESLASHAAMMRVSDAHRRSGSVSSQQLLNQVGGTPSTHRMSGLDNRSSGGEGMSDSPQAGFVYVPGPDGNGPMYSRTGLKLDGDPFYRPPRKRTMTNDALNPIAENRKSHLSQDSAKLAPIAAISRGGADSPRPPFLRDRADSGPPSVRTDYAVREVDQVYGQPLNEEATRKLKTGPADPEGPAANAQSWLQGFVGLFGRGKKKDKEAGKGFEVVRSSRMPPEMQQEIARQQQEELELQEKGKPEDDEPYRDSPELIQATGGAERSVTPFVEAPASISRERLPGVLGSTAAATPVATAFGHTRAVSNTSRDANHPGIRAEQPPRPSLQQSRPSLQQSRPALGSMDAGLGWITGGAGEDSEDDAGFEDAEEGAAQGRPSMNRLSTHAPSLGDLDLGGGLDIPTASRFTTPRLNNDGGEWSSSVVNNTSHRRAADSITRNSFGANAALHSASAEIVPGSSPEGEEESFLRRG